MKKNLSSPFSVGLTILLSDKKCQGFYKYCLFKKQKLILNSLTYQSFFFLIEGKGFIEYNRLEKHYHDENEFILFPRLAEITFNALQDSWIIIYQFEYLPALLGNSFLYSLYSSHHSWECFYKKRTFIIHHGIKLFLENICMDFEESLTSKIYELKEQELFILILHYFSGEELFQLFYPLIGCLFNFRQMILENSVYCRSAQELCQFVGMKRHIFEERFKKEFGSSPYKWLIKRKAESVMNALSDCVKPIPQIRKEHFFNSSTHFIRFCRNQFGITPLQIRNKIKKEKEKKAKE